MPKTKTTKPRPQTTLVTVAVTTAGPVPMKWVRDGMAYMLFGWAKIEGVPIKKVSVKRDANIERPRR